MKAYGGYDALDRLTSTILPASTFAYGYDPVGNRLSKSTPSGTDTYAISATSNRLASITGASAKTYTHDPNGSITGDGVNGFTYDPRGRLVASTSAAGATTYQVNALGQRVRKTSSLGDVVFHYDTQGRLIAESSASGSPRREYLWLGDQPVGVAVYSAGGSCPAAPTVDTSNTFAAFNNLERLEVRSGRLGAADWEWGLGNNTQQAGQFVNANLNWVNGKVYGFTLTYSGAGSATMTVRDGGTVLFTQTWASGMDAGNALKLYVKSTAGIGAGNKITLAVTSIDGQAVTDSLATAGDGNFSEANRVYAGTSMQDGFTVEGTVKMDFTGSYPPQGSRLNMMVTAGNVTCAGGSSGTATLYYVHADHLNTPRVITNQAQQVVWRLENQEPFGNSPPEENPSGIGNFEFNLRFPGQYFDKETGLAYNYFRDYDSQTGRYIQSDPIGLDGGINPYLYVDGDPVSRVDPTGECPWCLVGAALGAGLNVYAQLQANGGNWNTIQIQQVGFAAASGFLSGGLGTATAGLRFGWNVLANTAGSGAIGAGVTVANNALYACDQRDVWTNAWQGAAFGGVGAGIGNAFSTGYRALQNARANAAWARMTVQQRNLAGSNAIAGPFYPGGGTPATVGTIGGNLLSNTISNWNQ